MREPVQGTPDPTAAMGGDTLRYIELVTSLHYLQNGQWMETREKIQQWPAGR